MAHLKVLSRPGVKHNSVAKGSPLLRTFTGIITIPVKIGGVCGQKAFPRHSSVLKARRITWPSKIYEKETMGGETYIENIAQFNRAH